MKNQRVYWMQGTMVWARRGLAWGRLWLVLILLLGGCAPAPVAVMPAAVTRPLVLIASDSPGSADPAENWNFGGAAFLPQIYDTLFRFVGERSPKLEPSLAAEIPTTENGGITKFGLVYIVKIRKGATFHDGSPVNADAVIFSYDRVKSLKLGVNGITADWIDRMEKVDAYTVRFTLKQPFADFLYSMGSMWGNYIVNPAVVRANNKDGDQGQAWLKEHDAGSGPFMLEQFDVKQNQVTLRRYANYWGGWKSASPVEQVVVRWLADSTQARTMLEKGQADVAVNIPSSDFAALDKKAGFISHKYPGIMQYYLGMNASKEPLLDARVRAALHYSFNRDRVISEIFNNDLIKMNAAVGPAYPDVYPASTQYSFDLEKARELLKQAGVDGGLEITLNLLHFWPNDSAVAKLWQEDLAKIGVKLTLKEMDGAEWSNIWFDTCSAVTNSSVGEISTMAVGGDYPSAWEVLSQVYPTPRLGGGKCSAVYMDNPLINNLIYNIGNTTDPSFRQTLFQSLYDNLAEDDAAIWIGQAVDRVTMRDSVQGFQYSFALGGNYIPLTQMSMGK